MKHTYCIPAALALALLFTGPVMAEEKKQSVAPPAASLDGQTIKGKVLETMDAGGYTYLLMDAVQGKTWVAVPQTKVEVGKDVVAQPGMIMTAFESKTLGKTFDVIIFSSGLGGGKGANPHGGGIGGMGGMGGKGGGSSFAAAMQAESAGNNSQTGMQGMGGMGMGVANGEGGSGGSSSAIVPAAEVKVEKATGENGQTIEECFARAKDLDKKTVQVRGKVMKVSTMIMGKNWLHLQDGTGNPMSNTHDLVVTTQATPEKGSVVVVEGVLAANKDFGSGYKYDVIIEDAEVK